MIDIVGVSNGSDLRIFDAQTSKGANVLQTQIGDLEYAPEFGIDLRFFIDPTLRFQNDSFKSYLIQRLAEHHINVADVIDQVGKFEEQFTFLVGEEGESTGGFIR